jgi:hypothetical protein
VGFFVTSCPDGLGHVGAGAERFVAAAGQDDHANIIVCLKRIEALDEFRRHLGIDSVVFGRPV